jgi:hypothetical protein
LGSVVIISPQGPTRVNSEIDQKASQWKDKIIVPKITRASGRTLIAVVDTAQLGGVPAATWGYQVLMQSNEGFPAKTDLLTRKVNEFEGQHRFGGGTDYDNDPQVMDIFAGKAQGRRRRGRRPTRGAEEVQPSGDRAEAGRPGRGADDLSERPLRSLVMRTWLAVALLGVVVAAPVPGRAETGNFELNGKIYTKFMYKNDASRGCLSLSNPFWPDNIGGSNGVCSEFELNIQGRVSKYITSGVRLQSRWGALWQSWWENGDIRWDSRPTPSSPKTPRASPWA